MAKQDTETALLAGVDGGGTRTRAVILRGDEVLGRGAAGPANPNSGGVAAAVQSVRDALHEALRAAGTDVGDVAALGLGLAGVGASKAVHYELLDSVESEVPCRVGLWTDVVAALAGAFAGGPGVLVASGTGSVAIGFDGARTHVAGGWGRRIGDAGSGHDILRRAAAAVLAERDGLASGASVLGGALAAALELEVIDELVPLFARDPRPEELTAGVAAVQGAAGEGDRAALAILEDAGRELARLAHAIQGRMTAEAWPVALTGGLLAQDGPVRATLIGELGADGIREPQLAPERGAALLAAEQLGLGRGSMRALLKALGGGRE